MNGIILGIFWLIYYGMVAALSSDWVKQFFAHQLAAVAGAYRILLPLFSGLNFGLLAWFHYLTPSQTIFRSNFSVQLIGFGFAIGAILVLLFSFSQIQFRFLKDSDNQSNLKWTPKGMYRYVRFPLYFAVVLMLFAIVLVFPVWKNAVFLLVTILYIWIGALMLDRKRIDHYGEEYLTYRKKVKMLIPFLV